MAIDRRATRLGVLALAGVILFGLLGVRLWFLQTVKADELQENIEFSRTRTVRLAPERGRIVDREGRILADNERILSVGVDWAVLRRKSQREDIFRRLSGWIDVAPETMEEKFDPSGRTVDPFQPYIVRRDIDEPTAIVDLAKCVPGGGVHEQTVHRWTRSGVLKGKKRIKLRTMRIGGRKYSTRRWLSEFLAAMQDDKANASELLEPCKASEKRRLQLELSK